MVLSWKEEYKKCPAFLGFFYDHFCFIRIQYGLLQYEQNAILGYHHSSDRFSYSQATGETCVNKESPRTKKIVIFRYD